MIREVRLFPLRDYLGAVALRADVEPSLVFTPAVHQKSARYGGEWGSVRLMWPSWRVVLGERNIPLSKNTYGCVPA